MVARQWERIELFAESSLLASNLLHERSFRAPEYPKTGIGGTTSLTRRSARLQHLSIATSEVAGERDPHNPP